MKKANPLGPLLPLLPEKTRGYVKAGLATVAGLAALATLVYGDNPVVAAVVTALGGMGLLPTGEDEPTE